MEENHGQYRVRWAGYRPSWEKWRVSGEVGGPIETWEPRLHLEGSEALVLWEGLQ